MEFPVKTDFFPQVRLTAEERRRYVATGENSAMALRNSMKTLDWKKTMEKDGVTYAQAHCIEGSSLDSYSLSATTAKGDDEPFTTASACLMMSATAFAAGTISETLEALASPVTGDYRRAMHFLYGSNFIDGVCLHTIAGADTPSNSPNNSKPNSQAFTTVKWAAFDDGKGFNSAGSPTGTDYCFLEHSGIHRGNSNSNNNTDGNVSEVFGFSIQESITREGEVPSLGGVGLARGRFHRTGILVLPTDRPDVVQVTSILQMRMAEGTAIGGASDNNGAASGPGKSNSAALARRMRRRVSAVGRLDLLLERRRLNKLEQVPRAEWVADNARKACAVCVKPFALRRRKHHCRHCGEVVCASCAPAREVDGETNATTNVRICTACVVQSRAGAQTSGYDTFVFHLRDTGSSSPSSLSSTNSTVSPPNNNAEVETRPKSLSSGSSTFSISSDSQMSARLTRAGYAGGAIRLYDYDEDDHLDVSSGSSSSYSLSEFDSFDSLVAVPTSNQNGQRRGSSQPSIDSSLSMGSSSGSTSDLLERIRGMKADLSTLTTSYRHFSDASTFSIDSSATNSFTDEGFTGSRTPSSALAILETQQTRSSNGASVEGFMDIDFINDSEQFTLLCPETLSRQWRTRTSSRVRQDAGEKSHLSASILNTSFVSTLSNSTMLEEDEDQGQRESRGLERTESQAELQALRQQVEGLHRSLAAATSQIDSIHTRRASRRASQQQPIDPVAARHMATYGLLVEELHEIMGLPRPCREH
ncbi:Lateral signaling target protein 2 [Phytophthora citrophthora]|uniref:Lateral signaling target protein 2 n=1 Tax=Phytophthora citrophthora TaxID=4793 RepID=A0AAD9G9N5_9STRA|nr:Lateral signaling target protein 2 [Phytophthora citrophthora]